MARAASSGAEVRMLVASRVRLREARMVWLVAGVGDLTLPL